MIKSDQKKWPNYPESAIQGRQEKFEGTLKFFIYPNDICPLESPGKDLYKLSETASIFTHENKVKVAEIHISSYNAWTGPNRQSLFSVQNFRSSMDSMDLN